jgi:hypothetical protein
VPEEGKKNRAFGHITMRLQEKIASMKKKWSDFLFVCHSCDYNHHLHCDWRRNMAHLFCVLVICHVPVLPHTLDQKHGQLLRTPSSTSMRPYPCNTQQHPNSTQSNHGSGWDDELC